MSSDVYPHFPSSHARKILSHLLQKLRSRSSRHYQRYGEFLESAPDQIEALLWNCIQPDILRHIECEDFHPHAAIPHITYSSLRSSTYHGRSIYLHTIYAPSSQPRLYIGQAYNTAFRIAQHLDFRYRRSHRSLHHYALELSAADSFTLLATLTAPGSRPGMQRPDLVLNILEMWCCLVFKTLQPRVLREWLPEGLEVGVGMGVGMGVGGLNLAVPLDQGTARAGRGTIKLLEESEDPLVREYYELVRSKGQGSRLGDSYGVAMSGAGKVVLAAGAVCAAVLVVRYFMRRTRA